MDETPMQARRRRLGLSIRQLSEYTGIDRGRISWWERGRYVATNEEQAQLTGVLQDFELAFSRRGPAPFLTADERKIRGIARQRVGAAIRRGELVCGPCEKCGDPKGVAHHRWGYADPLRVVWLCGSHHGTEHREMNEPRIQEATEERQSEAAALRQRAMNGYREPPAA